VGRFDDGADDGADHGHWGHQILADAGIEAFAAEPDHPARMECVRAALRLHRRGCTSIGLVPASAQVGVVGVGVNLAIALAEVSGNNVGYVDANLRWPALQREAPASSAPGGDPEAERVSNRFSTRWLRNDVALLVPRQRVMGGAGVGPLSVLLSAARAQFGCCLVDLTGWRRLGEHLPAFELVDGVAVIARAGLTTELELLRFAEEIPRDRHLGVLLTAAGVSDGAGG
jgi:hypothetical protein